MISTQTHTSDPPLNFSGTIFLILAAAIPTVTSHCENYPVELEEFVEALGVLLA